MSRRINKKGTLPKTKTITFKDALSIADFEDEPDELFKDDVSDLISVADLPDEPTHSSNYSSLSSKAPVRVNNSTPNSRRAVYTVPPVVNFQNWENTYHCWGTSRKEKESKDNIIVEENNSADGVPLLNRVLIIKNVDVCSHCAVISAPLTSYFRLTKRGKSPQNTAPFDLLLEPGATISLNVSFYRPKSTDLELWDNFRDAIVIYTERYSITVPFRALRCSHTSSSTSFTPPIKAMKLPSKPSDAHFKQILERTLEGMITVTGPNGFGTGLRTTTKKKTQAQETMTQHSENLARTLTTANSPQYSDDGDSSDNDAFDLRHQRHGSHEVPQNDIEDISNKHKITTVRQHVTSVAVVTNDTTRESLVHKTTNVSSDTIMRDGTTTLISSSPKTVHVDSNDDAAALILQMRRKLKKTAPVGAMETSSATRISNYQSGISIESADDVRNFQKQALREHHRAQAKKQDENHFYRELMRLDEAQKKVRNSRKIQSTNDFNGSVSRGRKLSNVVKAKIVNEYSRQGPNASSEISDTQSRNISINRASTPGPQSRRRSPKRNHATEASEARRLVAALKSTEVNQPVTQRKSSNDEKRSPLKHDTAELNFYQSLIRKQKPASILSNVTPTLRPQSQEAFSSSRPLGENLSFVGQDPPRSQIASALRKSIKPAQYSSSIHNTNPAQAKLDKPKSLKMLQHAHGSTISTKAARKLRAARVAALRPGQRITVRAPLRRNRHGH